MELIDRNALLAAYDAAHKGPPGGARKLIEEAPSVGGWNSVKDRLPKENGHYLVSVVEGYMQLYLWIDGMWFSSALNVCDDGFVTHWMPLPEPPKEDNDGE